MKGLTVKLLEIDIAADATAGKALTVPFACDIIEAVVHCKATVANGAVAVWDASAAITDAMAMAVDNAQARSASLVKARVALKEGQVIKAKTANAGDRGKVSIYVQPV